jgi:hypothetical protein
MNTMFQRSLLRLSVFVAGAALAISSIHVGAQDDSKRGRKYKVPPPSSRIEVTILRAANGKPIESAAVIFHPIEGDRDKGGMELKTNQDGKAIIDVIPVGDTVRMQVIAHGFQTYGQDFKIDKDSMTLEVRMKRPGEQYSIYKAHPEAAKSDPATNGEKPSNSQKEAENQPAPGQPQPQTN